MPGDEKLKNDETKNEVKADVSAVEEKAPENAGEIRENKEPARSGKSGEKKKREGFSRSKGEKKSDSGFIERVIKIGRVSKVVKGGKNFSFSALVVTGDGKGNVGIGLGKSNEVVEAIKKGTAQANKSFIKVTLIDGTIPHEMIGEFKASRVIMKPAGPGTGVIAGGPVRAMCDAAGIKNILTKTLGSRNAVNVVKATENGFKNLMSKRRGSE
ncbi:MAG: 30S ribosomal protein S5 [Candidatus Omnitrophota bacterium]